MTIWAGVRHLRRCLAVLLVAACAGLAPRPGVAVMTEVNPGSFTLEEYFSSSDAANQACWAFTAIPSFSGYAPHYCSPGTEAWTAGWYCVSGSAGSCPGGAYAQRYLGVFWTRSTACPSGQVLDRESGACIFSPKNPSMCSSGGEGGASNIGGVALVGNPINPGAGTKGLRETDILPPGLHLRRYYTTGLAGAAGGLGANWSHTLGRQVLIKPLGLWLAAQRETAAATSSPRTRLATGNPMRTLGIS